MVLLILSIVFSAGCVGGLIGGLFGPPENFAKGESTEKSTRSRLQLRYFRKQCKTWFPSLLGNMLVGGTAAVIFWCLYGPFSGSTIIGEAPPCEPVPRLTSGQLASCLLIGMSGAGFLLTEAGRRCAERTNGLQPKTNKSASC